jgi:hypothetical protein
MAKDKITNDAAGKPPKPPKMTKAERKEYKAEQKAKEAAYKEWENSIVANKRVKRELNRRRMRRVVLIILIMSLMITSSAYIILLLVQENSLRISATYSNDKTIGLSLDGESWLPYLDVRGPESMWNISYDPMVAAAHSVDTVPRPHEAIATDGNFSTEDAFIGVTFLVKNTCELDYMFTASIELERQINGLDEAIRVMWVMRDETTGEIIDNRIFAKKSNYAGLRFNDGIEYIAYPDGYFSGNFVLMPDEPFPEGLYSTTPFQDEFYIMRTTDIPLSAGAVIRCSLVIWIEGSDPECTSSVLNSYLKIGARFSVQDEEG